MMNNERLKVSFYSRKNSDQSEVTIYCRMTIDGIYKDFSTGRVVAINKWDEKKYRVRGYSETAISVNENLEKTEIRLHNIVTELISARKMITTKAVYDKFKNVDERKWTVLGSFKHFIDDKRKLGGVKSAVGATVERYEITMRHLQQFMRDEYGVDDKPLVELDMLFINRLYTFLVGTRKCCHNSSVKYIRNFRTIIRKAVTYDWLQKDPFLAFKARLDEVDVDCLTQRELKLLKEKEFDNERLEQVRDVFLFACWTGYSYSDMAQLTHDNIEEDDHRNLWIKSKRIKTKVKEDVPVTFEALRIIDKYRKNPKCVNKGLLVPVISNQKYNAYLKEIADLCGIKKKLTSHIARHNNSSFRLKISNL